MRRPQSSGAGSGHGGHLPRAVSQKLTAEPVCLLLPRSPNQCGIPPSLPPRWKGRARGWRTQSQTHMDAQRTFLSTAGLTRFSEVFFFFLAPPGLNGSTWYLRSLLQHARSLSIFFFPVTPLGSVLLQHAGSSFVTRDQTRAWHVGSVEP